LLNEPLIINLKKVKKKLLQVGFIKPVEIINWVFLKALMKKNNKNFQMCINYQILNRNIQKNHFPLPFINITLDEVVGHKLYIFMDGYSRYNHEIIF